MFDNVCNVEEEANETCGNKALINILVSDLSGGVFASSCYCPYHFHQMFSDMYDAASDLAAVTIG